jgi:glycosyltransferase involved in cell wall biosynthesis
MRPNVSVVIPCLNEEENVGPISRSVAEVLERAGVTFEIIFIDNASTDDTVPRVRALCAADPRIRLIVNNRNYGQMRSPTHGIYQASGDAVIGMCCDFQDPPHLLGPFIDRWRAGSEIVLGVREAEENRLRVRLARSLGYGFMRRFADYPIIPDATGFGLYDRKVVDLLASIREPEPFFRGMLVESGYRIECIPYERPQRARGASKNNFFRLLDFAISGFSGSSKYLLRVPIFLGLAAFVAGLILVVAGIAVAVAGEGWNWLIFGVMELHFGALLVFLGLTGDQVRLISERTRNAPLVVERERVNFPTEA